MHNFGAYTHEDIQHMKLCDYIALRNQIPSLRARDLADLIRGTAIGMSDKASTIANDLESPRRSA